ncbi:unnamed protein product, partial [Mesorhabditis belari]|uniref:Thyroglobulin type-1 domain-containing protein n=1 Tax=Mesorhabditis belari TaxID=2138241 RepID=A0AAF3FBT4_9BILA
MRAEICVLLGLCCGVAWGTIDSHTVHVYHSSAFDQNELCSARGCGQGFICFVAVDKALCVKREVAREKLGKHKYIEHGNDEELLRKKHQHNLLSDAAKHERQEKHLCSRSELDSIGGRLMQWFKDMHRIHDGKDVSLKKHKVACRPDVAWMFEQWDGNDDGQLSQKELKPIEGNMKEPCLTHFFDLCDDMVIDGEISVDEWCDCFSFSDDYRHEPPCHKEKHHADPHVPGVFIPRCDLEGFYQPEQCHGGQCWCVDKYGREFDQSRVQGELPDCGQYGSELSYEEEEDLHARM